MNTFDRPQGIMIERARQIFAEIADAEELLRAAENHKPKRMAASALYAAAMDSDEIPPAVAGLGSARAFHHSVIAESAAYAVPQARAAASTTQTLDRHGENCHIHVEPSRAEPTQFYVVVELSEDAQNPVNPTSLVVFDNQDRCRRFPLPAVRNGVAQMIAEGESDLMRLIGDPTTRVYLT